MQKKGESQRLPVLPALGPGPIDVVGFGENSVDIIATVPRRPESDEKLELLDVSTQPGGQVASALVACARLGCRTGYVGVFGDDSHAKFVEGALQREGIDTSSCVRAPVPNRSAVVIVEPGPGTRTVLWRRDDALAWPGSRPIPPAVSQARLLLVDATDVPGSAAAARAARAARVPVVLDIDRSGEDADELLCQVDILICSQDFPQGHTGERTMGEALRALYDRYQPAVVVATLGAAGAVAWDGTQEIASRGFTVPVVDSTGAGDAFRGGFVSAWIAAGSNRASLMDLLRFANGTAALNCRARGAQTGLPSKAEVTALLTEGSGLRSNQSSPGAGTGHQ